MTDVVLVQWGAAEAEAAIEAARAAAVAAQAALLASAEAIYADTAAISSSGVYQLPVATPPTTASISRSNQDKISDTAISVFDFIPANQHSAILAGSKSSIPNYNAGPDIQAAIDQYLYTNHQATKLVMPHGAYPIEDTLHWGYGDRYVQGILEGAGERYRGESAFKGSVLLPNFSDRPAFNIQQSILSIIRNVAARGLNWTYVRTNNLGGVSCTIDDTDLETWVDPTLHSSQLTAAGRRYAPYAAFTIDAYSGTQPTNHYPDVTFPAWSGISTQYGKGRSQKTIFDRVYGAGFIAGLVASPSGADGSCDFITLYDSHFEMNQIGASISHTQARQLNTFNCFFENNHTCLTNNKNGMQQGDLGGGHFGSTFDRCINIFDLTPEYAGPVVFDGCYGELVWRLGKFASGTGASSPVTFNSSHFTLDVHPVARGIPDDYCVGTDGGSLILYNGGKIQTTSHFHSSAPVLFSGAKVMTLDAVNGTPATARQISQAWSGGFTSGSFSNLYRQPLQMFQTGRIFNVGGVANPAISMIGGAQIGAGRGYPLPRAIEGLRWSYSDGNIGVPAPRSFCRPKAKSGTTISLTGISGTVDFGAISYGVAAGDLAWDSDSQTVFLVTSMAGTIASVTALTNYHDVGEGSVFRTAINPTVGTWYISLSRIYTTTYPMYGTMTSGSPIIATVGTDNALEAIATDFNVGDLIFEQTWTTRYFAVGAAISSKDATAKTITMNSNARASGTALLPFWIRT